MFPENATEYGMVGLMIQPVWDAQLDALIRTKWPDVFLVAVLQSMLACGGM
jgi:hypothetical protein